MPKVLLYSYAAFLLAYLIGSLSFAVIISKRMRLPDPRTVGSKNPGATNVLRTGSKVAAVLTLLLDGAKGLPRCSRCAIFRRDLALTTTPKPLSAWLRF